MLHQLTASTIRHYGSKAAFDMISMKKLWKWLFKQCNLLNMPVLCFIHQVVEVYKDWVKSLQTFFVSSGSQLMKFQANFQSYSSVFSNHLQTVSHSSTVTSSESPVPQFVIFMDTNIPPLLWFMPTYTNGYFCFTFKGQQHSQLEAAEAGDLG